MRKSSQITKLYPYASETQQHEMVTSLSLIVRLRMLKNRNIVSRREPRGRESVDTFWQEDCKRIAQLLFQCIEIKEMSAE